MTVPLAGQIKCVERELRYRRAVYSRRVQRGAMERREAAYELEAMESVLRTLEGKVPEQLEIADGNGPNTYENAAPSDVRGPT